MKAFNRFIAVLFAIAFVIAAPVGVMAFNLDRTFLSAQNLMRAADEVDFYGAISAYAAEQLRTGEDAPLATLPEEDVRQIASTMLPREVLRPIVEETFTQLVAFGHAERDNVEVSMVTFKQEMRTRFPEAILRAVSTKPVCASREEYGSYTCRPHPADQAQYEQNVREAAAHAWGENVPDTYSFVPTGTVSPEDRAGRAAVAAVMKYAPFIALGLLASIAFFAVRGVRGLLLWLGVPLMISGLLLVVCWLLSSLGADEIIRNLETDVGPDAAANAIAAPLFQPLFDSFVRSMMIWAGVVAVTGFGMTIAGSFLPRAESSDAA